MNPSCLEKQRLQDLMNDGLDPPAQQAAEAHLLECAACRDRYSQLEPIHQQVKLLSPEAVWGSAIVCAQPASAAVPRGELRELLAKLEAQGMRVSSLAEPLPWIVADVSSHALSGDEMDAARLAQCIRDLRTALSPGSALALVVHGGRGGLGARGPYGVMFDARGSWRSQLQAGRLSPAGTLQPGQVPQSGEGSLPGGTLLLGAELVERLQPLGFPLGEPRLGGSLVPASSASLRWLDDGAGALGRGLRGLWAGMLEQLPIQALAVRVAAKSRSSEHTRGSTDEQISIKEGHAASRTHSILPGEVLELQWELPAEAWARVLLRGREGWQLHKLKESKAPAREERTAERKQVRLPCPPPGEPKQLWLLASSGRPPEEHKLEALLGSLPLHQEGDAAALSLGERLKGLFDEKGFLLLSVGALECRA